MLLRKNEYYVFIEADKGKYLHKKGEEGNSKLLKAIYKNENDIPEFEEKDIEE